MSMWNRLERGDKVLIATTAASLAAWWLVSGRHKYGVPKGAK